MLKEIKVKSMELLLLFFRRGWENLWRRKVSVVSEIRKNC